MHNTITSSKVCLPRTVTACLSVVRRPMDRIAIQSGSRNPQVSVCTEPEVKIKETIRTELSSLAIASW